MLGNSLRWARGDDQDGGLNVRLHFEEGILRLGIRHVMVSEQLTRRESASCGC